MSPDEILSLAGGFPLTLRVVEECGSTNDELKRAAQSLPAPYVLIARRQTGGKGRMGRGFFSPEGSGLYMSILLRPELGVSDLPLLTPAAAVAVAGAIEGELGVPASIKWVNDVYAGGKKVCGILTESSLTALGGVSFAVVGIGVNVSPPRGGWPEDLACIAGSVLPRFRDGACERLAAGILRRYFALLPDICSLSFSEEYSSRLMYVGETVELRRGDEVRNARLLGADRRCGLRVQYPGGAVETLTSGEITLRRRVET